MYICIYGDILTDTGTYIQLYTYTQTKHGLGSCSCAIYHIHGDHFLVSLSHGHEWDFGFFSMVPAFQHFSTNCEASKLSKKKCLDDFPMFFLWCSYDFMIFQKMFNCLTIVSPMIFRCPVPPKLQLRIHPSHQGKGTTLQKRKRTQSSCGKLGVYKRGIPQKWIVYNGKSHLEMDDLCVFPIWGNFHLAFDDSNSTEDPVLSRQVPGWPVWCGSQRRCSDGFIMV